MMRRRASWTVPGLILTALLAAPGVAQEMRPPDDAVLARASHVIVPQARGFSLARSSVRRRAEGIEIASVRAHVSILEQTATTTLEVAVHNPGGRDAEAVMLLPVPRGGVVSAFDFHGGGAEPTARLIERREARRVYDDIVRRARDPALLEFAGHALIRSSVFPVPAGGDQKVRVRYEQVLAADANRVDYVLPRSEALDGATPWTVTVDVKAKAPISTVYSPSHEVETERVADGHVRVSVSGEKAKEPGSFRLSYLLAREGVSASLFAYPDPKIGGGYFLLIAGLPPHAAARKDAIRREVTLVIDRSGSMAGPKMDQVRAAALQVVEGLADGEAFNIIDYGTTVESLSPSPLIKGRDTALRARRYIADLRPTGGTNIHDALTEALRQDPTKDTLPIVLFLTDGLPTVGQTSEVAIRDLVEKGNPHRRRVFTFGVGVDVNVPLLDRVAELSRGAPTYVLPREDVEVKVAAVFRRLYGPVLSDATLEALDMDGRVTTATARELIPADVPDLFEGDQFVLLGQYRGAGPLRFRLRGSYLGSDRAFAFTHSLARATTRNAFVPRLWASRRIAYLADAIRIAGAEMGGDENVLLTDPKYRELVEEIVRLSMEFGVLSDYTAFLATEGTDLTNWRELVVACGNELDLKTVKTRTGAGAMNGGLNAEFGKKQSQLNGSNRYWNQNLERVAVSNVQQVCDRAFFRRGENWVDSRLIAAKKTLQPDRVVEFGSEEHLRIVRVLIDEGRQAVLALRGGVVLEFEGQSVLVRDPRDDD